jgi:hypothetical protein
MHENPGVSCKLDNYQRMDSEASRHVDHVGVVLMGNVRRQQAMNVRDCLWAHNSSVARFFHLIRYSSRLSYGTACEGVQIYPGVHDAPAGLGSDF